MSVPPPFEPPRDLLTELEERGATSHRGAVLSVQRHAPLSTEDIAARLQAAGLSLSGSYRAFLEVADGMSFFGVPILGIDTKPSILDYPAMLQYQLVPFHDWGNGDMDCLDLTKAVAGEPPVIFWDDKRDTTVMITNGFSKWMRMAHEDLEKYGKLLHPDDYNSAEFTGATGTYESPANIRQAFFGTDDRAPKPKPKPASKPTPAPPKGKRARLKALFGKLRSRD